MTIDVPFRVSLVDGCKFTVGLRRVRSFYIAVQFAERGKAIESARNRLQS
jgi:hypothetical protein